MLGESLRARREAVVREHMEAENRHEFDVTMATFDHPRYEIVPTGDVYDGTDEVARYFAETRAAFPDQRNELIALHHAQEAYRASPRRRRGDRRVHAARHASGRAARDPADGALVRVSLRRSVPL